MKFGLRLLHLHGDVERTTAVVEEADRLGFESAWLPEHLVVPADAEASPDTGHPRASHRLALVRPVRVPRPPRCPHPGHPPGHERLRHGPAQPVRRGPLDPDARHRVGRPGRGRRRCRLAARRVGGRRRRVAGRGRRLEEAIAVCRKLWHRRPGRPPRPSTSPSPGCASSRADPAGRPPDPRRRRDAVALAEPLGWATAGSDRTTARRRPLPWWPSCAGGSRPRAGPRAVRDHRALDAPVARRSRPNGRTPASPGCWSPLAGRRKRHRRRRAPHGRLVRSSTATAPARRRCAPPTAACDGRPGRHGSWPRRAQPRHHRPGGWA